MSEDHPAAGQVLDRAPVAGDAVPLDVRPGALTADRLEVVVRG
jgi:hypothetical protein